MHAHTPIGLLISPSITGLCSFFLFSFSLSPPVKSLCHLSASLCCVNCFLQPVEPNEYPSEGNFLTALHRECNHVLPPHIQQWKECERTERERKREGEGEEERERKSVLVYGTHGTCFPSNRLLYAPCTLASVLFLALSQFEAACTPSKAH